MIHFRLIFLIVLLSVAAHSQTREPEPELSSILSLFSAHAGENGIRLNWTLDRQSPTIQKFRLYRGYEEVGNFAVLTDVDSHEGVNLTEYAFTDTTALPGVSYYYKISAAGQSSESIFPVVISATSPPPNKNPELATTVPAAILPGEKVSLYVRTAGRVKLDILGPSPRALVNDTLRPGIYEFDALGGDAKTMTLKLNHDSGYDVEVKWPVH